MRKMWQLADRRMAVLDPFLIYSLQNHRSDRRSVYFIVLSIRFSTYVQEIENADAKCDPESPCLFMR